MTFLELQTQTMMLVGVSSVTNSGFTQTELELAINNVMPMIASEIEDLLTYCQYDTVASTQVYAIPEHYLTSKMLKLETATGTWEKLIPLSVREFEDVTYGRSTETGPPEYYKVERWATANTNDPQRPGDIWLFPIPDAVYEFHFYYYQRPTELTATGQVPELPIHWHMCIAYRAAEIIAIKQKNMELARYLRAVGDVEVEKAKTAAARPQRDVSTGIVDIYAGDCD